VQVGRIDVLAERPRLLAALDDAPNRVDRRNVERRYVGRPRDVLAGMQVLVHDETNERRVLLMTVEREAHKLAESLLGR
jgi:hypothetical protein